MQIKTNPHTFFVFDLDDTLFPEILYLQSAYRHIAAKLLPSVKEDIYEEMFRRYTNKENVFQWVFEQYQLTAPNLTINWLLTEYREHVPAVSLDNETGKFLEAAARLSVPAGLITDGRSITQRNKLKSLGIENYFSDIIISEEFGSEKPDERNYLFFQHKYAGSEFYFFGDNTRKDFIVPARLGWRTVCIKDCGTNIHPQDFTSQPFPDFIITSFNEVKLS